MKRADPETVVQLNHKLYSLDAVRKAVQDFSDHHPVLDVQKGRDFRVTLRPTGTDPDTLSLEFHNYVLAIMRN